jgi:hypothetical protein
MRFRLRERTVGLLIAAGVGVASVALAYARVRGYVGV